MDKVEQLYNLYLQKGLISKAVTLDDWRNVNPDQQAKLFQLGKSKNLFSSVTENDFKSAWGELKKKETSQPVSTAPQGQRTEPSAASGGLDYTRPKSTEKRLYGEAIGGIVESTSPLQGGPKKEKPKQPPMDVTYRPEGLPSETTQSVVPKSAQEKIRAFDVAEKEIEQGQLPSNPELRTPETVAKVEKKREQLGMNTLEEGAAEAIQNHKDREFNENFADVEDIVDDYIKYSDNNSAKFGTPDYDFGSGKGEWAGLPGLGGKLQKEGGTDIGRQGKRGEILKTVMDDYFSYLQKTNPNQAEAFRNKYSAIKSSTNRNENDEKFLQGIESHALKLRAAAIKKNVDVYKTAIEQYSQIEKRVNFQGYDKDIKDLKQSAKNLNQEYKNGNISEADYTARWNQIQKGFEDARIKNGLTEDVVSQLEQAKQVYFAYGQDVMKMSSLFGFMDENSKEYRQYNQLQKEIEEAKKAREEAWNTASWYEKPFMAAGEFARSYSGSIGNMVLDVLQAPKVLEEFVTGDTSYNFLDEYYDGIENFQLEKQKQFGETDSDSVIQYLTSLGGNSIGSITTFALGGSLGGASKLAQFGSTFTTAFLSAEAGAYEEAINTYRMNPRQAATAATAVATATALVEGLIPDIKYFEASPFRKSVMRYIAEGKGLTQAAREALPSSASSYLKTGIKEGGEELAGQLSEDVTKEAINFVGQTEYFKDLWKGKNYRDSFLGGFVGGTTMNVFKRPQGSSPLMEGVMLEAAENADAIISQNTNEKIHSQLKTNLSEAKKDLESLRVHPNWSSLDRTKKGHVFGITQQIKSLESSDVKDPIINAQIEKLKSEREELLSLGSNGIDSKTVGTSSSPQRVMIGGTANEEQNREIEVLNQKKSQFVGPRAAQLMNENRITRKDAQALAEEEWSKTEDGKRREQLVSQTQGEQANFFINEDGDYEIEYNNGKSVVIPKGEGAAEKIRSMGIKSDTGEVSGVTKENTNTLITPKLEKGATIDYNGKNATINSYKEKDGKVVYVNVTTEDGRNLQIREGQPGAGQELLNNLNSLPYDQKDQTRISGQVGVGQESVETKPIETAGQEAAPTSGVLQTQEEVTPSTELPTKTIQAEAVEEKPAPKALSSVEETAKALEGKEGEIELMLGDKVIHHGTGNEFEILEESKQNSTTGHGDFGKGFYFSLNKGIARYYTLKFDKAVRKIKSFIYNISKPFEININNEIFDEKTKKSLKGLKGLQSWEKESIVKNIDKEFGYKLITKEIGDDRFSDILKTNGFDAVWVNRTLGGETTKGAEIVLFNKESVSEITNKSISEAYHTAKSKPESEQTAQDKELVKAVEDLIGKPQPQAEGQVKEAQVSGEDVLPKYKTKSIAERFNKGLNATSIMEGGEIHPEDVTQRAAWRSMGKNEFNELLGGKEIGGETKKGGYFGDNPSIASSQKGEGKYLVEFGGKKVEGETTVEKVSNKDITGVWKFENGKWNKLSKADVESLLKEQQAEPKAEKTEAEVVEEKPVPSGEALSSVEETAKALEGKKTSLDEKAKKLGYIGIKQFNAQNQLREDLSAEEKELLKEYSDFQQEVKNLKDESVISKLNDDEFSAWSKANDITRDDLGKVVKDEELELAAKRIRILNARGDVNKAESELKKLRESKKKDNWTVESWKERFDEDVSQSEIDEINESNKVFNEELDKQLVKEVEDLIGKPTEVKAEPTKALSSVEETAKALEEEFGFDRDAFLTHRLAGQFSNLNSAGTFGGHQDIQDLARKIFGLIQEGGTKNLDEITRLSKDLKKLADEKPDGEKRMRSGESYESLFKESAAEVVDILNSLDKDINSILFTKWADKYLGLKMKEGGYTVSDLTKNLSDEMKSKLTDVDTVVYAYGKAKAENSSPELVKAVEDLIGKPGPQAEGQVKEAENLTSTVTVGAPTVTVETGEPQMTRAEKLRQRKKPTEKAETTTKTPPASTAKTEGAPKVSESAPAPRRAGSVEASNESNPDAGEDSALEGVGMTKPELEEWKKNNKKENPKDNSVLNQARQLVNDLFNGAIPFKTYLEKIKKVMPSKLMDKIPTPATFKEIIGSIDSNKLKIGIVGLNKFVKKGMRVGLRIDIPAFNRYRKNVVTIHDRSKPRPQVVGYGSVGSISNVKFTTRVGTALNIGLGEKSKEAFAMAEGDWMDESQESIMKRAEEALNSPEWVQVTMNPAKHSFFYDKADGNPVIGADEVIQIGNLVLAKNPKKIDISTEAGMKEFEKSFTTQGAKGPIQYRVSPTRQAATGSMRDVMAAIESTRKALAQAGIDVIPMSNEEFMSNPDVIADGGGEKTEGIFFAEDGKILLNLDMLKSGWGKTIVFHEGTHPIINIIRNADPKRYAAIVEGIKREAKKNPKAFQSATNHAEQYRSEGDERVEDELVTEVIARISSGQLKLSNFTPSLRDKIISMINYILRALGLPQINLKSPEAAVRAAAQQISDLLNKGGKLSEVVGKKNVGKYKMSVMSSEAEQLIKPGSQIFGTNIVSQRSIADSRIDGFDTTPSKVTGVIKMKYPKQKETIEQVLEKSGGAAVFVNSDGTKVGEVLINGKTYNVQGGIDYTFIEKNYNDNVGFAASDDQKIKTLNNISKQITEIRDKKDPSQKGKPVAVFVVCQNGEAMLGEWYAGEYIMEGIDKALTDNLYPGGVEAAKKDLIDALNNLVITTKTEDGLKDNAARKKLLDMIENGVKVYRKQYSFDTHECRMEIADFLSSKDVSFGFRSKLNGEIIAANQKLTNSGKNRRMKAALASVGHHMQDFWNNFADGRFLPGVEAEKSIPEKGKVFANKTFSGFYYDPFVPMREQIKHTKKGIAHRQFNSKFKSTGDPFLLTNAHNVNKLFPDMGYADTEGYEIYNKANNKSVTKKSSLEDRLAVSEWLNANGYNENVINPYSSISLSIYTGYVTEEYKSTSQPSGKKGKRSFADGRGPLPGAPTPQGATGPTKELVDIAENYAKKFGIPFTRQGEYVEVDEDFATEIAKAYEAMKHDPTNPKVKEAYEDLIRQTTDQYNALVDGGYEFTFFDGKTDPYKGNPVDAMRDLRANKKMAVFGTYAGYGTGSEINIGLDNPSGGPRLKVQDVLNAVRKAGGEVISSSVHTSNTEPTLVVKLKTKLDDQSATKLSKDLGQEAISQRFEDETGKIYGPQAEKWGDYNPEFFITSDGRRASEISNPMLTDTGMEWPDQNGKMHKVTANDLFRAVHDAFGHGLEGAGFRARGEENAWQAHVRLFTGPAIAAITTETRGQNSWLNYGPYGEQNRRAKLEDTIFAEQKTGLMPEWTWTERLAPSMEEVQKTGQASIEGKRGEPSLVDDAGLTKSMTEDEDGNYIFYHKTNKPLSKIDPKYFGKTLATSRSERPGVDISMYYTRKDAGESMVGGNYSYIVRIPKDKVYPINADPLNLYDKAKKEFQKDYPGQAFDANKQVGYITKEAQKLGYVMTVSKWQKGPLALRAQTTQALKPETYYTPVPGSTSAINLNEEIESLEPNEKKMRRKGVRSLDSASGRGLSQEDAYDAVLNKIDELEATNMSPEEQFNEISQSEEYASLSPEDRMAINDSYRESGVSTADKKIESVVTNDIKEQSAILQSLKDDRDLAYIYRNFPQIIKQLESKKIIETKGDCI